jgi:hypothetical protein
MTTDRPAFMHGRIAMDKDVAASLLSLAKSLDDMIVKMFAEVEKFEDERAKLRFKAAVGDLMGSVARDIIFPLENAYPDFKNGSLSAGAAHVLLFRPRAAWPSGTLNLSARQTCGGSAT